MDIERQNVVVFFFVFNNLRGEAVVCFVDVGGIVDHHCLNFPVTMSTTDFQARGELQIAFGYVILVQ